MAKVTNMMQKRGRGERSSKSSQNFRDLRHSNFVFYQNLSKYNYDLYSEVNKLFNGIDDNAEVESDNLVDYSTAARFSSERVADVLEMNADAERNKELALLKQHYWDSELNIEELKNSGDLVRYINILMDGKDRFEYTIERILKGKTAKIGMGEFMVTGVSHNYSTEEITKKLKEGSKKVEGYLTKKLNEEVGLLITDGIVHAIQQTTVAPKTIDDWAVALQQLTSFNSKFLDYVLDYVKTHYEEAVNEAVLGALDKYFDATVFKGEESDENRRLLQDLKQWIDQARTGMGSGIGGELLEGLKRIYGLTGPVYDDILNLTTEAIQGSQSGSELRKIIEENIKSKLNIREAIKTEAKSKGLAQEEFKKFCFQAAQEGAKYLVANSCNQDVNAGEMKLKFRTMAKSTGGEEFNLSKPDNTFFFGLKSPVITNAIDTAYEETLKQRSEKQGLAGKMGSRRGINTLAWKKVQTHWNALKKEGFVVYSSVKLTSTAKWKNFEGFNAENIALSNLSEAFRGAGMKQKSDYLISAIENSMTGAIYEGHGQEITNGIAQNFAYFLFDDFTTLGESIVDENGESGINSIHLMDLNGVYIPLSVMLYGLAEAVRKESDEDIKKILTANINYGSAGYIKYEEGPWDYEQWLDQRNVALTQIKLKIKIMKNFVEYVKEWMREIK